LTSCLLASVWNAAAPTLRGVDGGGSAVVAVEIDNEEAPGTVSWYCPLSMQCLWQWSELKETIFILQLMFGL
jgi:hypothetical protein